MSTGDVYRQYVAMLGGLVPVMVMDGMMNGMGWMMGGMGLLGILILVVLILGIVALLKYITSRHE